MKIIISGGGTSGHVNPGIAVARSLSAAGDQILFVGTIAGPEAVLVERAGFDFQAIDVVGRERGLSRRNFKAVWKLAGAIWQSLKIVARANADVVLGTGGYVSFPVVVAAAIERVPIVIHEQNAVLGLANRLSARFAKAVAVSFPNTAPGLRDKVQLTGNPVRPEIALIDRNALRREALEAFGFEPERKTLLVMGGSQGAASINRAALGAYDVLRSEDRLQVLHLAGPKNAEECQAELQELRRHTDALLWTVLSYAERMDLALAIADLAVCRSGATTVFEMAAVGVPAIFVPYPYALDKDQLRNAEAMAATGGARIVPDSELSPETIVEHLSELIFDETRISRMSAAMRTRAVPDAAARLADLIQTLGGRATVRADKPSRRRADLGGMEGYKRLHLIGVGGAGMSTLARLFAEAGIQVSGSDRKKSATTESLRRSGIEASAGHDPTNVKGADAVIASSAVPDQNVEIAEARRLRIPVMSRGEAVAKLISSRRVVAIAGTHGKTTTSAMTLSILEAAGLDPLGIIGGPITGTGSGGRLGLGEWAVVEADEAFGSFLLLEPEVAAVTNIDEDHLGFFGGIEGLEAAFKDFVHKAGRRVVVCADDERAARLTEGLSERLTYGLSEAEVSATDIEGDAFGSSFDLVVGGEPAGRVSLALGGRQNLQNALGAAACALAIGLKPSQVIEGLERFRGVGRRFEWRGTLNGAELRDDYAHHPRELQVTLAVANSGPWSRVIAVFQPHLYSRTQALSKELGEALTAADVVVVTDVDGAREEPVEGITGKLVSDAACEAQPGKRVVYLPSIQEASAFLRREARAGDLVVTLGCGYINELHDLLVTS